MTGIFALILIDFPRAFALHFFDCENGGVKKLKMSFLTPPFFIPWHCGCLNAEYLVVCRIEYPFYQNYLVRVQMTLPCLYFCHRAARYITAVQLQLRSEHILSHVDPLTQHPDIITDLFSVSLFIIFLSAFFEKVLALVYIRDIIFLNLYMCKN